MQTLLNRLRERRWANLFVVNLRILLGFAFLPAGLKKLLNEPFTDPANTGTFHEFVQAFYATGFFYQFVGAVQLTIAALLMTQTYATLGALLAVPVFTAITVFTWSTSAYFTATMATLMLLGTVTLVAWDFERWRGIVYPPRAPAAKPSGPPLVDVALWQRCGAGILALYLTICMVSGGIYRPRGADFDNPAFYLFPLIALFPVVTYLIERRRRGRSHDPASPKRV